MSPEEIVARSPPNEAPSSLEKTKELVQDLRSMLSDPSITFQGVEYNDVQTVLAALDGQIDQLSGTDANNNKEEREEGQPSSPLIDEITMTNETQDESTSTIEQLREKLATMQTAIDAGAAHLELKQLDYDRAEAEADTLRNAMLKLLEDFENLQSEYGELESSKAELQAELDEIKAQNARISEERTQEKDIELDNMMEKVEMLQKQLSVAENMKSEALKQIEAHQAEHGASKKQVAQLQLQLEIVKTELEAANEQNQKLNQKVLFLEHELGAAQRANSEMQTPRSPRTARGGRNTIRRGPCVIFMR